MTSTVHHILFDTIPCADDAGRSGFFFNTLNLLPVEPAAVSAVN